MARMIAKKTDNKSEVRVRDYKVLLEPVLTEKSSMMGGEGQSLAFKVDRRATKTDIRDAMERIFKVEVASIRTVNYSGKPKQTAKSRGNRASYKKAYVTLKEGHRLDLVEGV